MLCCTAGRELVERSRDYLPLEGEDPLASLDSLEDIRGSCCVGAWALQEGCLSCWILVCRLQNRPVLERKKKKTDNREGR